MHSLSKQVALLLEEQEFAGDIEDSKQTLESHAADESIFYIKPELVIFPRTLEDIQMAVKAVASIKNNKRTPLSLTPRAAGSGLSGGSLNESIIINTNRYLSTIHGQKENENGMVYTVDPGVMYRDLEKVMDKEGLYIPSYPASKDLCTIGGMVANNAAGPDTFYYGQTAEFVRSLEVVLADGECYTIQPLVWSEFEKELKRDDQLGRIYRYLWELYLHHEEEINKARPQTAKNSAGYALWDVISTSTEELMRGRGVFDATRIFTGSQGTLGIITRIDIEARARTSNSHLLVLPIRNIKTLGETIQTITEQPCINIELFDKATFKAALEDKQYFKKLLPTKQYWQLRWQLYKIYLFRFYLQVPSYIVLVTLKDSPKEQDETPASVCKLIRTNKEIRAWWVKNPQEADALWHIRKASYTLSKARDPNKRPAAFLEDVTIAPHKLPELIEIVQGIFTKYNLSAYVHGHGGNGHLHFYPLMDFTLPKAAELIPTIAQEFFKQTTALGANICGEHNDGIIRTPYLSLMFNKTTLATFAQLEHICDPLDIFNPGKKVNPTFTIKEVIRHSN